MFGISPKNGVKKHFFRPQKEHGFGPPFYFAGHTIWKSESALPTTMAALATTLLLAAVPTAPVHDATLVQVEQVPSSTPRPHRPPTSSGVCVPSADRLTPADAWSSCSAACCSSGWRSAR